MVPAYSSLPLRVNNVDDGDSENYQLLGAGQPAQPHQALEVKGLLSSYISDFNAEGWVSQEVEGATFLVYKAANKALDEMITSEAYGRERTRASHFIRIQQEPHTRRRGRRAGQDGGQVEVDLFVGVVKYWVLVTPQAGPGARPGLLRLAVCDQWRAKECTAGCYYWVEGMGEGHTPNVALSEKRLVALKNVDTKLVCCKTPKGAYFASYGNVSMT
jgi:hypothetical protein